MIYLINKRVNFHKQLNNMIKSFKKMSTFIKLIILKENVYITKKNMKMRLNTLMQ